MSNELLFGLYIFVLAGFLGHYVISKVPPLLHTPLMAGDQRHLRHLSGRLPGGRGRGLRQDQHHPRNIAVTCATINTVGGFLITDHMLRMFKKKRPGDKKP